MQKKKLKNKILSLKAESKTMRCCLASITTLAVVSTFCLKGKNNTSWLKWISFSVVSTFCLKGKNNADV
jgi:hypothetical protein